MRTTSAADATQGAGPNVTAEMTPLPTLSTMIDTPSQPTD